MDGLFAPDMLPVSSIPPSKVRTRAKARRQQPVDRSTEWPLEGAINVVLFAGMGGACQGLEDAGYPVHVALNHDETAIAAHRALNPHTRHFQVDIYEAEPIETTGGLPVNILWLSPDCRDHSVAKGGAPRSPRVRSMPWQGCRWVGALQKRGLGPQVVYLENVREIRGWGPLIAKRDPATGRVLKRVMVPDRKRRGKMKEVAIVAAPGEQVPVQQQFLIRDPRKVGKPQRDQETGRLLVKDGPRVRVAAEGEKVPDGKRVRAPLMAEGKHYRAWKRHMKKLGARYEDRDLVCAKHGVPTSRARLFGVAVFDDRPIVWPKITHGPRDSEAVKSGKLLPYRAAAEIIDWSLKLPSIFERSKDLAPATQKRIAIGFDRFVRKAKKPFLVHLTHQGERAPLDVDDPPPTVTGAHRGEMAVVGAAVVPTTHTASGVRVHDGLAPTPTLTAGVKGGEFAVMGIEVRSGGGEIYGARPLSPSMSDQDIASAAALIIGAGGRAAQSPPMDVGNPLNASTTKEDRGVVAVHVTTFRNGAVGHSPDEPTRTFTAQHSDHHPGGAPVFGLVAAHLTRYHGERRPSEARGVAPGDSFPTNTTENRFGVVGATLAPAIMANNTNNVGASVEDGVPAATTGNRNFVIGAHLTKFNENSIGQPPGEPIDTLMAGATRFGVVGAYLTQHQGQSIGQVVEQPVGAQTQIPHHAVTGVFLEEHRSRDVGRSAEDPLSAQTAKEHTAVIGATMIQTGYGEREGQAPRALDLEDALGTQVAGGAKHAVVGAWMVQHNTGVIGHTADEPVSAMTTAGTQQQVATAYLTEFRGTSADGQPATDPAGTMCAGGNRGGGHDGVTAAFLSEYYGIGGQHQAADTPLNTLSTNDRFAATGAGMHVPPLPPEKLARARQVAAFLRRHGVWDDREFVTLVIDGITWIVVDIGMRMLTPREAAAAHELRMPDLITVYKRDRKGNIVIGPDGKPEMVTRPLTKTEAMRLVGNSVPKRMAMLLAEANAVHALHAPSRQMQAAE